MRSCNATKTRAATATRSSGSARRARAKANGRPDSSLVAGVRVAGWPRRPGSARRPRASGGRLEPAFESPQPTPMRTACRGSKGPRFGCHPDVNRNSRRRPDGRWPGCRPQSVPAPQGTDTNGSAPETVADTCGRTPPARPPRRAVTPKTTEVFDCVLVASCPGTLRSWIQPTQDGKSSGPFTTRSPQTATPPPFASSPRL